MSLIERLTAKLQRHPKRIVFPEGTDPRILQAARLFKTRRMGVPILVGDRTQIKERAAKLNIDLTGIRLIEPERSESFHDFVRNLENFRRYRGMQTEEAGQAMQNPNMFATMMLATGQADAIVSGATATTSSALRPLFRIIPLQEGVKTASSMLILDLEKKELGLDGVLFLADCGVIPDPTAEQLADIAITTARIAFHLTNETPRVAMLGFSSKASNPKHASISKMQSATALAREKVKKLGPTEIEIDGELQADAALDPHTAEVKAVKGFVSGRANVLIFPDLNSGNIASKLVQIISGANSYGQIITGLQKPAAEVSRGHSAHDVFGAACIVGCQAIDHRLLYGDNQTH